MKSGAKGAVSLKRRLWIIRASGVLVLAPLVMMIFVAVIAAVVGEQYGSNLLVQGFAGLLILLPLWVASYFVATLVPCPGCGKAYGKGAGSRSLLSFHGPHCENCGIRLDGSNLENYGKASNHSLNPDGADAPRD
jgi:hypothetical protein